MFTYLCNWGVTVTLFNGSVSPNQVLHQSCNFVQTKRTRPPHRSPRPFPEYKTPPLRLLVCSIRGSFLNTQSMSTALSLVPCTSTGGGQFSRSGRLARHRFRPSQQVPTTSLAINMAGVLAPAPPLVDYRGSCPSSDILSAAVQQPIFQTWKIGPDIALVPLVARLRPPSTSPASPCPHQYPCRCP